MLPGNAEARPSWAFVFPVGIRCKLGYFGERAGSQAGTDLSPILTRGGKSSVNNLADHQPVNERNGSEWVKAQLKSEYEANG